MSGDDQRTFVITLHKDGTPPSRDRVWVVDADSHADALYRLHASGEPEPGPGYETTIKPAMRVAS